MKLWRSWEDEISRLISDYQDIQLPEASLQEIGQPSDAGSISDIQLVGKDMGQRQPLEPLDGFLAHLLVQRRQNDGDAIARELPAHL